MMMLFQALGTMDVSSVMSNEQIIVFTLFVLFYVPCIATIAVLWKEFGLKWMAIISLTTLVVAFVIAMAARVLI
jgi:ferrous iron transport protein B